MIYLFRGMIGNKIDILAARERAVLLNHLLNLGDEESVFLAEECLHDLLTLPVTREILRSGVDADSFIEVQGLGTAFRLSEQEGLWLLLTDRYSEDRILPGRFKGEDGRKRRTVSVEERDFLEPLIEYFAESMKQQLFCESCPGQAVPVYAEERIERLQSFLEPLLPKGKEILEVCCGNGTATQAMLRSGHRPFAMDSDRCDLCGAMLSGRMDPKHCFVLDARLLPHFFPPRSFDIVLGFMVGLIDACNWPTWKEILLKSAGLAREMLLFTVYTQKEAEIIAKALAEAGWGGEVIDNRDRKGIYDQWACLARRDLGRKG